MVQEIIESVLELKMLIIVSAIGILLTGFTLLIMTLKFDWNAKNRKIMGFFYELDMKGTVLMAVAFLRLFFAIAFITAGFPKGFVPAIYYGIILVVMLFVGRDFRHFPMNFLHSAILSATMIVMGLLGGYIRDVFMDKRIVTALVLLSIFLILYTVCDIFRCANQIMDNCKKKRILDERISK